MLSGKLSELSRFKLWLEQRQRHFDEVSATPTDIAEIALQEGFDLTIVTQWKHHRQWEDLGKDA